MKTADFKAKSEWNDLMYGKHPTPYHHPLAGLIERYRVSVIKNLAQIKPNASVLEIGCEGGRLLNLLPPSKKFGLDISKAALKNARKILGKKVKLIHADAEKRLNLKQIFDVIICSQTLEHVRYPKKIMANIKRLSGKDTKIIISVPNEKFITSVKRFLKNLKLTNLFLKGIENKKSEWHLQIFHDKLVRTLVEKDFHILKHINLLNIYLVYFLKKKG